MFSIIGTEVAGEPMQKHGKANLQRYVSIHGLGHHESDPLATRSVFQEEAIWRFRKEDPSSHHAITIGQLYGAL
jgi:hypothetical protein